MISATYRSRLRTKSYTARNRESALIFPNDSVASIYSDNHPASTISVAMSAENAPEIPTYADCARTPRPASITREFVSKDDKEAPAVHCTNVISAGGVRYSTWFGGSYEGSTDNQIWWVKLCDLGDFATDVVL